MKKVKLSLITADVISKLDAKQHNVVRLGRLGYGKSTYIGFDHDGDTKMRLKHAR